MSMYVPPALSLEEKIIQKLMFEPAIDNSKIHISAQDNIITLFGTVGSLFEKKAAERAVKSVEGVKGVANELQVDVTSKYKRTDTDIAKAVINALKWDVAVPEDAIQVSVENGEVTLTGKVDWWYQKNSAEKAVQNLSGVKNINNEIVICLTPLNVKDVKNKIAEEFQRNAAINVNKINVEIDGHKIILKGSVNCWPEMKEAVRAAWSVAGGVTEVENQLIISISSQK